MTTVADRHSLPDRPFPRRAPARRPKGNSIFVKNFAKAGGHGLPSGLNEKQSGLPVDPSGFTFRMNRPSGLVPETADDLDRSSFSSPRTGRGAASISVLFTPSARRDQASVHASRQGLTAR